MDFKDYLTQLAARIAQLKEQIATEEATKNAFIMPFIQMLGYDVFNPLEVIPEMDCDLIKKKGEKIDYAIMKEGEPIILIECKHWQQNLSLHDNQLQKYFVASKAKFGVLTNGIQYKFYTDLVKPNIMDDVPFLEIDMENLKENQIEELKKFHKSYFDIGNILSTASELKYMSELRQVIKAEFAQPSPELVKLLTKRVYEGVVIQKVLDQFTTLVKRTLNNYVNDAISEKLNIAIKSTEEAPAPAPATAEAEAPVEEAPANKIVTTEEELEGFYIVKSILREVFPPERITYRDAVSYFAIFVDDNNRKPIIRLYFNRANSKRIAFINDDRKEEVFHIDTLDEIYNYQDKIREAALKYL